MIKQIFGVADRSCRIVWCRQKGLIKQESWLNKVVQYK